MPNCADAEDWLTACDLALRQGLANSDESYPGCPQVARRFLPLSSFGARLTYLEKAKRAASLFSNVLVRADSDACSNGFSRGRWTGWLGWSLPCIVTAR